MLRAPPVLALCLILEIQERKAKFLSLPPSAFIQSKNQTNYFITSLLNDI
jgi:hypothetical protein